MSAGLGVGEKEEAEKRRLGRETIVAIPSNIVYSASPPAK